MSLKGPREDRHTYIHREEVCVPLKPKTGVMPLGATEHHGLPAATRSWEGQEGTFLSCLQRYLDFRLPARSARQYISIVLSPQVCSHFLQQPREMKTPPLPKVTQLGSHKAGIDTQVIGLHSLSLQPSLFAITAQAVVEMRGVK